MDDLKLIFKLADGVQHDSTVVALLVKMGMVTISSAAIYDGMAQHQWSDAQLAEIERLVAPINFLADYQFSVRSEAVASALNIEYFKDMPRADILALFTGMSDQEVPFWGKIPFLWPVGWWDLTKCEVMPTIFGQLRAVDPQARRAFPEIATGNLQQMETEWSIRLDSSLPWVRFGNVFSGGLTSLAMSVAQGQVWVDETRIACALERYRLAHGAYPSSLDMLAPAYLAEVPHDIMNGESYHYRLQPDGTFLLYSVGGNQKDEGGKVVYQKNGTRPDRVAFAEGDWMWPMPQVVPAK